MTPGLQRQWSLARALRKPFGTPDSPLTTCIVRQGWTACELPASTEPHNLGLDYSRDLMKAAAPLTSGQPWRPPSEGHTTGEQAWLEPGDQSKYLCYFQKQTNKQISTTAPTEMCSTWNQASNCFSSALKRIGFLKGLFFFFFQSGTIYPHSTSQMGERSKKKTKIKITGRFSLLLSRPL